MTTASVLESHGYKSLYLSQKFDLWERKDKRRLYANLYDPPTVEELKTTVEEIKKTHQDYPRIDLITDHTLMTNAERVPPEDVSVCFENLFDAFEIRYFVRICQADKCGLCLEEDTSREKGRLLGRAPTFEAAEGLLDNQGELPD